MKLHAVRTFSRKNVLVHKDEEIPEGTFEPRVIPLLIAEGWIVDEDKAADHEVVPEAAAPAVKPKKKPAPAGEEMS